MTFIKHCFTLIFFTTILFVSSPIFAHHTFKETQAAQEVKSEPNGSIWFYASLTEITRLSIKNDRIRRIINDSSQFEMTNDETTGDIFLRYTGKDINSAIQETGFIVTEKGFTITYVLRPQVNVVRPIILTISGQGNDGSLEDKITASAGFGDDIATTMSDIIKVVFREFIEGKVPKGKNGKTVATTEIGDWNVRVIILSANNAPKTIIYNEFTNLKTRAIWIQKKELAPNEKTFAIIVEAK
jgi:hypothetical protein